MVTIDELDDDSQDDDFDDKPKVIVEENHPEPNQEEEVEYIATDENLVLHQNTDNVQAIIKNNEFLQKRDIYEAMVKSKMLPKHIKTAESAFAVELMGKELGFDTMTSFNNIIPIEGTLTLKADAQSALMMRAGVRWKVIYDGHYMFTNGEILAIKPYGGKKSKDGKSWLIEPAKDKDGNKYVPYDRITRLEVKYLGETHIVDYYWSDAKEHGLTDKLNWQKMPREMLMARCKSKVRTQLVSGVTLGLYSTDEIVDSSNKELNVSRGEDGTIININ